MPRALRKCCAHYTKTLLEQFKPSVTTENTGPQGVLAEYGSWSFRTLPHCLMIQEFHPDPSDGRGDGHQACSPTNPSRAKGRAPSAAPGASAKPPGAGPPPAASLAPRAVELFSHQKLAQLCLKMRRFTLPKVLCVFFSFRLPSRKKKKPKRGDANKEHPET